jgi:hypothetical protein
MINDFKIIDAKEDSYDNEVLNDLSNIGKAIEDAKNGLGDRTSMSVIITDV